MVLGGDAVKAPTAALQPGDLLLGLQSSSTASRASLAMWRFAKKCWTFHVIDVAPTSTLGRDPARVRCCHATGKAPCVCSGLCPIFALRIWSLTLLLHQYRMTCAKKNLNEVWEVATGQLGMSAFTLEDLLEQHYLNTALYKFEKALRRGEDVGTKIRDARVLINKCPVWSNIPAGSLSRDD